MRRPAGTAEAPGTMAERPAISPSADGRLVEITATSERGSLADVLLHEVRVESAVLCRSVMRPPWGFAIPERPMGSFHVVLEGGGWLEVEGHRSPLHAGTVIVLPHGSAHRVSDRAGSEAPPLAAILEEHEVVDGEVRFGGGSGARTEIVCGTFTAEGIWPPAWAGILPAVVGSPPGRHGDWRIATARALRDASSSVVVNRLLETLLADALREALATSAGDVPAIADAHLGPAVRAIHERPEAPWTVSGLASLVAMSRSTFASRFADALGRAPMRYVRDVRLDRAARLLRSTDKTIGEIASRVGYGDGPALSRAFTERFATTPQAFRRAGVGDGGREFRSS